MANSPKDKLPKVLLVVRAIIKNGDDKILMIQRHAKDSWEADKWEFPGGKVDIGQEIHEAMAREVLEETNLDVRANSHTAHVSSYIVKAGKYEGMPLVSITFTTEYIGNNVKISKEHKAYQWVSRNDAMELDLTTEARKTLVEYTTPF